MLNKVWGSTPSTSCLGNEIKGAWNSGAGLHSQHLGTWGTETEHCKSKDTPCYTMEIYIVKQPGVGAGLMGGDQGIKVNHVKLCGGFYKPDPQNITPVRKRMVNLIQTTTSFDFIHCLFISI